MCTRRPWAPVSRGHHQDTTRQQAPEGIPTKHGAMSTSDGGHQQTMRSSRHCWAPGTGSHEWSAGPIRHCYVWDMRKQLYLVNQAHKQVSWFIAGFSLDQQNIWSASLNYVQYHITGEIVCSFYWFMKYRSCCANIYKPIKLRILGRSQQPIKWIWTRFPATFLCTRLCGFVTVII